MIHEIGDEAQSIHDDHLYVVDVELWHRGTDELARAGVRELRQLVAEAPLNGERFCDSFVGQLLCLARVAVRGQKLRAMLDLDIVAEVDLPPQPTFDHRQALRATEREFSTPPVPAPDAPSVCVVDSGIVSNHPLLSSNVGHAISVMTSTDSTADETGHGSLVSGIAVFGNIRACYESGQFSSPVLLYSARALNSENRFDDETLIIHQMRRAIETFVASPYNCRVFNLSLGDDSRAWLEHNPRQSLWAESLDILAREFNVVLVLSAGNQSQGLARNAPDSEEVLATYPDYLFEPFAGLGEPATAAIPITVGGIAEYDIPAVPVPRRSEDIIRSIAVAGEPTPTARIGPGLNGAIKPEFVAPAGNVAFQGMSEIRQVDDDQGLAVMSLSHQPTQNLFAFGIGTSYAAPFVARSASILLGSLRQYLGEEPDANLVRAVLASASTLPQSTDDRIQVHRGSDGIRQVYGYGQIDEDVLYDSADRRVTMVVQSTIPLDSLAIYEVPSPPEFRSASGRKHVTVTLAFDPPVRRRRADYLGVKMDYALIRGKTVDEIVEAYRQLSASEREQFRSSGTKPQGAFQGAFRCKLEPGPTKLASSTLQRSEWTFEREGTDYGESWYLVVRAQRTWAPESFSDQRFAATVTLQADQPELYALIRNRVRLRQQQRARARQ
ncbi:MAG: S8 family peptidase [Planctomycetaceae bacterium]